MLLALAPTEIFIKIFWCNPRNWGEAHPAPNMFWDNLLHLTWPVYNKRFMTLPYLRIAAYIPQLVHRNLIRWRIPNIGKLFFFVASNTKNCLHYRLVCFLIIVVILLQWHLHL